MTYSGEKALPREWYWERLVYMHSVFALACWWWWCQLHWWWVGSSSTHGHWQCLGLKPRDISVVDGGFEGLMFFMALDNPKKTCGETETLFSNKNVLTLESVKSITGIGIWGTSSIFIIFPSHSTAQRTRSSPHCQAAPVVSSCASELCWFWIRSAGSLQKDRPLKL